MDNGLYNFVIPDKAKVGHLANEVAAEGERVILSDGDGVQWTPPPIKSVVPDLSEVKSLKKYFGRVGFTPYPAWIYHPTETPRIVNDAIEAKEFGVWYREATDDERMRYGHKALWDWHRHSDWRPHPYAGTLKFDETKPGTGKTVIYPEKSSVALQNDLVERLMTKMLPALLQGTVSNKPADIDKDEYAEFLRFKAFKKASEAAAAVAEKVFEEPSTNALSGGDSDFDEEDDPQNERALWLKEAEQRGVHIDRRWSTERIRAEVEKA